MNGDVRQRVVDIVADALNVPVERVTASASLTDDLGAESIDFLDILFRVESAFDIKIPNNELWTGSIDASSRQTIDASIAELKKRQPDYRWDRLPTQPVERDLARLITVQTIVDYLQRRGVA
jgi:acyl carrier protein